MSGTMIAGKASFALRVGHNPDVLTCIANLSNDEVFTPPELANQMLDALERAWADRNGGATVWADPSVTFLDPFTKSGVFLREITKRLVDGLADQIPDLEERVDHILTRQVFGIGITQLTALLARRSVYCSKDATGEHSIATSFDRDWGNIWFERTEHTWAGGRRSFAVDSLTGEEVVVFSNRRCRFCGAAETDYGRDESLESHAYAFIHTDNIKARIAELFGADMQFDVIIGNPPYQLDDGGNGASAAPIYDRFVDQAKTLDPRLLTMVIPARWYAGGKGLNDFRESMLHSGGIRALHDFPDTNDVFPGVNNRGGICYFLWENGFRGDATVVTHEKGVATSIASRPLIEPGHDAFLRFNEGVRILRKVIAVEGSDVTGHLTLPTDRRFSNLVSSRNPFGLPTSFKGEGRPRGGGVTVYRNGGVCFASPNEVPLGGELIDSWKLFVSRASPGSDDYPHLVLSKPIVAGPGSAATDTYVAVGPFADENAARAAAEYMSTTFFRFMVSLLRVSINVTRGVYQFVPLQDFSQILTDEDLATKYGLTAEDQAFVARFVKPVAWAGAFK
ncbi:Eco57I restriction-modification methylase domain-containing protein [Microbacterium capsulatum]|uniref:site-specific DNA-methyltransferase (adenine-specific) n=1 Tax=Microbacterium capsulatum TaxID=3041921 RepID=A0ABU0XK19_9MICO|nr:Eco57I restriction-modification methylase domain-containing protein [Microbacterium sp. ASV81]MDQ4215492.1 Eco57I restriction-modification methylase domain-containing protein [Microbacterium sp. ASV81]